MSKLSEAILKLKEDPAIVAFLKSYSEIEKAYLEALQTIEKREDRESEVANTSEVVLTPEPSVASITV